MRKTLNIYLFLIAAMVGVELALGIFVAPTIFFPQDIIGENILTHFQSGQLMTHIFVMYNKLLMAVAIIILLFEMINFNNNKSQKFNLRFSTLMLGLIHICLALIFILYFTDYIVQAQNIGEEATTTESFAKIHSASEWCMKIIVIVKAILFFLKFPKVAKNEA